MTEEEKIICKQFLHDADKTHSCNEYKLLMNLIDQETVSKDSYDHEYFLRRKMETQIDHLNKYISKLETQIVEQEPTTKNCESCRYYGSHHEVCNYCNKCSLWTEIEPTTKNDLEVDAVSRAYLYNRIKGIDHDEDYECDEYGGSRITYHTCDWDEVLREIEDAPPVTPIRPKGHWYIDERPESNKEVICSNCEQPVFKYHKLDFDYRPKYCPQCGADMRGIEE